MEINNEETSIELFSKVLELSDDDKRIIYNKLKKADLIEMLIVNNNLINKMLNEKVDNYLQETIIAKTDLNIN